MRKYCRPIGSIFAAPSSYTSAVLRMAILSVPLSVRMSVTRVLYDERKEHTADILIPYEKATLVGTTSPST